MSVTMEPEAPGSGSPSDQGGGRGRGSSADRRAVTEDAAAEGSRPAPGRQQEPDRAAVTATRRLCPYLTIDGGAWRSAAPDRDHRCGALTPMPPLTLDKQRRLCLTDRHLTCATFLAARGMEGPDREGPERPIVAVGPGRSPDLETVTRWSIVRTTPVILDHSRVPVVGSLPRGRAAGQVGLAILLIAAFAALAIGRLGGPSAPSIAGTGKNSSPAASAPLVAAGSPTPEATATPGPTPTRTPRPSKTPAAPSATPRPTATPATGYSTTYKVKSGDTLYGISIRFNTTVKAIQQLNSLKSTTLHIGQTLKIP